MKSFKNIIAMVAMMALLASTAMAATVAVKKDGSGAGGYTTIADALAVAVTGDTVEIQDSEVYDLTAGIVLNGINLKCTAANRATIQAKGTEAGVDAVDVVVNATNAAIEGIKFAGKLAGPYPMGDAGDSQEALRLYGAFSVKNCFFQDFRRYTIQLYAKRDGPVLTGTIEGTYMVNGLFCIDCISDFVRPNAPGLNGPGIPTATERESMPTAADVGSILINHCTLLGNYYGAVRISADFPTNGGTINVKNTIMGYFDPSKTLTTGCYAIGCPFYMEWWGDASTQFAGAHPSCDVQHSYNAYIGIWYFKWNWKDIDFLSADYQNEIGPTEIAPINPKIMDPGFVDPFNYNLALRDNSKLIGKGEGGSTIGAFQSTAAPGPQIIVKKDGTGPGGYTQLTGTTGALAAATFGDLIEIQDSATYDEGADIKMQGLSLRGQAGQRPTITNTGGRVIYEFYDGTMENLNLIGKDDGSQMGFVGANRVTVTNCVLKNGGFTLGVGASAKAILTITDTYIINPGIAFGFASWAGVEENLGPYLINHCTIVNTTADNAGSACVFLDDAFPGDGSNVTVKNTIIGNWDGSAWVAAQPFTSNIYGIPYVNHRYNLYAKLAASGTITLGATEIKDMDPRFTDLANGDFSILPSSPAAGKGENLTSIGVFQVPPVNAAKSWTVFE